MRLSRSYWMVITYELIQKFPVLAIEPLGDYNGNCPMRPVKSHGTHAYTVWLTQANSIGNHIIPLSF